MKTRFVYLLVFLCGLAVIAPRAWGQFLSDEERKGMFSVQVAYSTRDYELEFKSASAPVEEMDAVLEAFTSDEQLDSFEVTVTWSSFGFVELHATIGVADYELTNIHATDSAFDTVLGSSDNVLYGVGATVRFPVTDELLLALDVGFLTGQFDDIEGEISQLDVAPRISSELGDIDWRELTIAPLVLYRFGNVLPYAGARFVNVSTEVSTVLSVVGREETFDRVLDYKNANELSGIVGLTWRVTPLIMANFEAQLFNNDRITFGIELTF